MKNFTVTFIYNIISMYFAARIAYEVWNRINEDTPFIKKSTKSGPFQISRNEKIKEAQHNGLDKFANIGAAVLPILLLSVIYLMLSNSFYMILEKYSRLNKYGDLATMGGGILAIIAFFLGKSFSKNYLDPSSSKNNLYETTNIELIEKRIRRTEISYLSFTFSIILFNYLDLSLKFNVFKGITTSFAAGTIYYIVYLQDTNIPRVLKNKFLRKQLIETKNNISDKIKPE